MTHPTPSTAIAAGACALCLGDGQTYHLDLDRIAACSACGGSGRLDDMLLCTCGDPACPDHGATLWPAGQPSWAEGYLAAKPPDDTGEWLTVVPLTFGRARRCVATPDCASLEHWCLDSPAEAIAAWLAWPEPPTRWNRHQRRDGVLEWPDGRTEPTSFTCPRCGRTSYNPYDAREGYCGACHAYTGR